MGNIMTRIEGLLGGNHGNPTGIGGRLIGRRMVRQHEPETHWTLSLLELTPTDQVLEIGFGAGRALELLTAQVTQGHIMGVDLSRTMVRAARHRNAQAVNTGQIELVQADAAHLPFADRQFDKIFSIHSVYFWSDLIQTSTEIERVLRPGGRLVLTLCPGKVGEEADAETQTLLHAQVIPALQRLGFASTTIQEGPDSRQFRSIAVVGVKEK